MDEYLHVQRPVNANLGKPHGITSNEPILVCSKSRQYKSLDVSLSGPILANSKSH
uniref:Uncharacterized protein n=1 Tax=viral metagenome TaxID=1070528 RepID=A0A6C0C6Z3_9ZZZZ